MIDDPTSPTAPTVVGRVATTERLTGIILTGGGVFAELVELVCVHCEREPATSVELT